jgi:hypothetical protein
MGGSEAGPWLFQRVHHCEMGCKDIFGEEISNNSGGNTQCKCALVADIY